MKLMRHDINAVCENLAYNQNRFTKKYTQIVHEINADIDQPG